MNSIIDNTTQIAYVPLSRALLCASCDTIYNLELHKECPVCTGIHYLKLEPIIGSTLDMGKTLSKSIA